MRGRKAFDKRDAARQRILDREAEEAVKQRMAIAD